MKKLLVGIDLTRRGYVWLLTRAADLASCVRGNIDLVYIAKQVSSELKEKSESQLEELMAHIDPQLRGAAAVAEGEVVEALAEISEDYDVLVVGPREPEGLRKWFENPIAVKVIATVNCPVFVPRVEQPKKAFPRLLLGIDFASDYTDSRIESAKEWATVLGAKVDVVYCSQSLSRHIEERVARQMAEAYLATQKMQREQLEALVEQGLDDATRGDAIVHEEAPGPGLVTLSRGYDIIVVGTADIKKTSSILGSVSGYVVRNAHCDVLTLP